MDKGQLRKLNAYHVIFLVQNCMVGVKMLTLPHDMSAAGYNQWFIPILLGVIAQLGMLPMIWLCKRYPDDTLLQINEKLLGEWPAKLINACIVAYATLAMATVAEGYARLVQETTLPNQNSTFPLLGLLFVMVYMVRGGIKLIARFCILAFFFTGWMVFFLQWGFQKGHLSHMLPLFNVEAAQVAEAVRQSFPAMFGFELILFYFPYIIKQEKALLHASIGLWITTAFYFLVTLTSVAYFSEWQLSHIVFPILSLFKAVELTFLERIETLGVGLWLFLILTTMSCYLWVAKKGVDAVLGKRRHLHLYIPVLLGFLIMRGPLPFEMRQIVYDIFMVNMGYGLILWPNLLLLLHWIRKPRRHQHENVA